MVASLTVRRYDFAGYGGTEETAQSMRIAETRMRQPFLQLPKRFCAETLAAEVANLPAQAWVAHPTTYEGNDAALLVAPGGQMAHGFAGQMAPTEFLHQCPYIMEVMAELDGVWGRTRLMRLAPGAKVPMHVDTNYYWRTHLRIHIPILTTPEVIFTCGGESVHMQPGEVWTFDSFRPHTVVNGGAAKRVHLVLDTVGSETMWSLIEQAESGAAPARLHVPGDTVARPLRFERENVPKVMSPWEMRVHIAFIAEHAPPGPVVERVFLCLDKFAYAWAAAWAEFGASDDGLPSYRQLIVAAQVDLKEIGGGTIRLPNGLPLYGVISALIFRMAVPEPQLLAVA